MEEKQQLTREEMARMVMGEEYNKENYTLSRLGEAILHLEHYNKLAKSGDLEQILYDLGVVMSEIAGLEQPIFDLGKYQKTWIGFGMNTKPEIKIKFKYE